MISSVWRKLWTSSSTSLKLKQLQKYICLLRACPVVFWSTEEDFPLVGPSLLQRTVFSFALRIISLAADCIYSLFFCCVPLKKKFIFAICISATHEIIEDSIKILPFPPLLQAEQTLLSPLQVRCCSPQQSYWCSNEVKPVYQCIFLHDSSISWQYMNGAK